MATQLTAAQLAKRTLLEVSGDIWFSKLQWKDLRDHGRDRTFAQLESGEVVEYTEIVTFETLLDEPYDRCGYPDAEYLGRGTYHHSEDEKGYTIFNRLEALGV